MIYLTNHKERVRVENADIFSLEQYLSQLKGLTKDNFEQHQRERRYVEIERVGNLSYFYLGRDDFDPFAKVAVLDDLREELIDIYKRTGYELRERTT